MQRSKTRSFPLVPAQPHWAAEFRLSCVVQDFYLALRASLAAWLIARGWIDATTIKTGLARSLLTLDSEMEPRLLIEAQFQTLFMLLRREIRHNQKMLT